MEQNQDWVSNAKMVDGRKLRQNLLQRIRKYEHRYEISSSEMSRLMTDGQIRETSDILKWMQDYRGLKLIEKATHTTGTPTTTTGISTKPA